MTHQPPGQKVLLLGGAGFLGSNILRALLSAGERVHVIDGLLPGSGADAGNLQELVGYTMSQCLVEDVPDLARLLHESDVIIDSIGLTSHTQGMKAPEQDLKVNLLSHVQMLKQLGGFRGFVISLGTRAQYGASESARYVGERDATDPIDVQGIHKQAAESYLKLFSKSFGFAAVSLRLTNCFGSNQKTTGPDIGLVGNFIRSALRGETIEVYGGERRRQFLYARDVARFVLELVQERPTGFTRVNMPGHELSVRELASQICRATSAVLVERPMPEHIGAVDPGSLLLSDETFKKLAPDFLYTPMDSALRDTIIYFEERGHVRLHSAMGSAS